MVVKELNEIYLINSAKTQADEEYLLGGNYPISFKGLQQIISVRRLYYDLNFDKVFSSELKRSEETVKNLIYLPTTYDKVFNELWFGRAETKPDIRTRIDGFKEQFNKDFIAFMKECNGEDPYRKSEKAIEKLQEIVYEMIENPSSFPHKRVVVFTSDVLIRCIWKTLCMGRNWKNITDFSKIKNLEGIKLIYKDENLRDIRKFKIR